MEPEQIVSATNAAVGRSLENIVGQILSFRTFCQLLAGISELIGGWLHPIIYRDAGERTLRGAALWIVFGLSGWGVFSILSGGSRTFLVAALWSVGLAIADWLAALDRRKRKNYMFSRFLGWPRLLPVANASYALPPVIVLLAGVGLATWRLDVPGGIMLIASATAILVELWTIAALRREDAFDLLDASWLAEDRSQASEALAAPGEGAADETVARGITTADMIRRFSI